VFTEAKDNGNGGDNWSYKSCKAAKLQSNHHHQQTNTQHVYRPDALPTLLKEQNFPNFYHQVSRHSVTDSDATVTCLRSFSWLLINIDSFSIAMYL